MLHDSTHDACVLLTLTLTLGAQVQVSQSKLGIEERGTYTYVFLQEIERSNILTGIIRASLIELGSCLKGDMQASEVCGVPVVSSIVRSTLLCWKLADADHSLHCRRRTP